MKRMKKLIALTLTATAMAATAAVPLVSAETGDFTIYPAKHAGENPDWIVRTVEKGSTTEEKVIVENLTDKPLSLNLLVRNANTQDNKFLPDDENISQNLPAWTSVDSETVTLAPSEKKEIPVTFTVPQNTENGQYAGAILAAKSDKNPQNINIVTRIGVRVYLDVTDPKPLMASIFTSPQYSATLFFILSLMALLGSLLYNVIHYRDQKAYAHK